MNKVVGLGAGGHAKVVIEILVRSTKWEIVGLLDNDIKLRNSIVLGYQVLGGDELLGKLYDDGLRFAFNGLGSTGDSSSRRRLFERVKNQGFSFVTAAHPTACVAESVSIGEGSIVMAGVVINPITKIGDNTIINTGVIVEHDCLIGNHVHIASGAVLAGGVRVNDGAHIGMGANILQGIEIGHNAIIGSGSNVINDVDPNTVFVGNPARLLRFRDPT